MPSSTVTPDTDNKRLAEEVYDLIMVKIEPDLLLGNIAQLESKYQGETPDEHELRMRRYEVAYKKYDEAFKKFIADVDQKVRTGKRQALQEKEQASRKDEQTELDSLSSAFN